jgi:hypothetical protein
VTITATDSRGATTSETFTHALAGISTVRVTDILFKVGQPAVCFQEPTRTLWGGLQPSGQVTDSRDRTEVVGERPSRQIRLRDIKFAGMPDGGFIGIYRSQGLRAEEASPVLRRLQRRLPLHGIDQGPPTGLCNNGWAARSYP